MEGYGVGGTTRFMVSGLCEAAAYPDGSHDAKEETVTALLFVPQMLA